MPQTMSLEHFAGHVHTTLRVNAAPHSLERKLVEAADLGALDLFLVPVGRHAAGFTYQAVFNRLVKG